MRIQKLNSDTKKNLLEDLLKRSPNNYGQYEASVKEILDKVKEEKDAAVFAYTAKVDGAELTADTIEVNCDTMLFLGGKEKSTGKERSESLGKETIDSFNTSTNRGQSESYGMNYQKLGKELKSQDELAVMDGGKCILQVRGVRPFFSDKFDITRHKQYPMLLDDNPEQEFNIENYVSNRREMRLKLPKGERFSAYGVDMTNAGQEVTTVSAKEKDKAGTAISEETEEKEIYVGF